jgi:XTP/dITP diphosphohydrolase
MELIIASNNKNKIKEIKDILKDINVDIKSLSDIGFFDEIEENGNSFEENSYIKAKTIFDKYKMPVIADDSGLEVEALSNRPGIYSHRYAGIECDDLKNNIKLINELKGIENRNAHYTCVISYINKDGLVKYAKGYVYGKIIDNPKGENGFGYDPHFYIESLSKTMAEISMEEKNKISHRMKALIKLKEIIREDINN